MTTTVGYIGLGLLLLIILWILALVFFVVATRLQSNLGWIGLAVATIITITLLAIPVENQQKTITDYLPKEKDYGFVYKNILLIVLILSVIASSTFFFLNYCIEPVRVKYYKQCSA